MSEKVVKIMQWLYERILKDITDPSREAVPISPEELRKELEHYE